ncbi:L-lactate dehydrogenase [Hydrogenispora ethanolica]|jgi:L-lactate dehydrogenase|uniref:L-lactate dehydrogenase n=1 Tax=Hydrogenispora ethanolica TaxID=1082276 RepID=A0A4R1RSM0_HYDET|nr:L-lactate dehydrogenase [Hydrogenispora ethanolica]TCL69319.1 L-lactate dehydrogenase [Hydrogenispora ethanolica]
MVRQKASKVVIIGAGMVGSTYAYSLMINGVVSEIAIIDPNQERLEGEIMDLNHGISFVRPVSVYAGSYQDCSDADLIVICAGANQKPGETRIDLLSRNAAIFRSIIDQIKAVGTDALLLIASNPVDIMTYITCKLSDFPRERVIGSGTVLDSARFRFLISRNCHVDPSNVHAYIIGEHGDTEVPVWSLANIAGLRFGDYCPVCSRPCAKPFSKEEIFNEVKNAAYQIIKGKGATYYAIGLALVEITESILRDEYSVLTVSSLLDGEYGLKDVCLSLPCVVSRAGIEQKIQLELAPEEEAGLKHSAAVLQEIQRQIRFESEVNENE